ncbi:hypothetical protein PBI_HANSHOTFIRST_87 [Mycobacterium phage HanShotFirst]|uniref:hypothetical protein n=1 Tax=Mycobacterium phage HanShotFirst TaxID=1429904 RepID=UPI0003C94827|nr:hypothetical protein PBI_HANSHOTFIRST_87 [Mycobacterium phage HanShotFirst]AHB31864.1 hypothetical protein PBI_HANSHOTFIRST_87 [Mycobacterium phage HanShotFirst]
MPALVSRRIRPGMYVVTVPDGDEYTVTDTEFEDGWYWVVSPLSEFAPCHLDLGLHRTKRDAVAALAEFVS